VGFEREVNFAHIETTSQFHKALAETLCSRTRVPHVTTLPYGRNSSFVCRDSVLSRIEPGQGFGYSGPDSVHLTGPAMARQW